MLANVLIFGLGAIAVHKMRGNTSALQCFVLAAFIGLCLTAAGVLTWIDGQPTVVFADLHRDLVNWLQGGNGTALKEPAIAPSGPPSSSSESDLPAEGAAPLKPTYQPVQPLPLPATIDPAIPEDDG
jgi:hypothetical protein